MRSDHVVIDFAGNWSPVMTNEGPYRFPEAASHITTSGPSLYRWAFEHQGRRVVYIGETDDLRRRVGQYLSPAPASRRTSG